MRPKPSDRRGMTLPELLVVVAIIGLLAVAVLPVLSNSRTKNKVREAADLAIAHLNHAMAKAMGSQAGAAAWYETTASEAGNDKAVVNLAFGRARMGVSGQSTVTRASPSTGTMTLNPAVTACLPAPIQFAGSPNRFVVSSTAGGFVVSSTANAGGQKFNREAANNIVPASPTTPIPYVLHLPPRLRMAATTTRMPSGICIDLSSSTIGVFGFSQSAVVLNNARRLAIVFDNTGRAEGAWYSTNHDETSPAWQFVGLDKSTPVALLVGVQANCGNAYVANPSEADPGAIWQDPDARWILIAPQSSVIKSIEVNAKANRIEDSQLFVRQVLQNAVN